MCSFLISLLGGQRDRVLSIFCANDDGVRLFLVSLRAAPHLCGGNGLRPVYAVRTVFSQERQETEPFMRLHLAPFCYGRSRSNIDGGGSESRIQSSRMEAQRRVFVFSYSSCCIVREEHTLTRSWHNRKVLRIAGLALTNV